MELRHYFSILYKWLWLIVASMLVAGVSAYFTTRATPNTYVARTTLMVGQILQNPNANTTDLYTGQALAQGYSDLIGREPVLQATLKALGLNWNWSVLQGMVQGRVVANTLLIEITVTDTDPQRARVLADEVAHQLILLSPSASDPEKEAERKFILTQINELKANIKNARDETSQLNDVIAKATSARQIQDARTRQAGLQAQVTTWQGTYAQLLSNLQLGTPNNLSVMEPAQLPTVPVGPRMADNILIAIAISIVLSGGAALILEYIDDTVKTTDDVRATVGLTVLGSIADIQGKDYSSKLMTATQPRSPVAEAYRMLRTNLQFSSVDNPLHTLVMTSSGPLEGKSVTSANLAIVIAQSGKRVILVDADLRRPMQDRIFKLPGSIGLTTLLMDANMQLSEVLQPSGIANLMILASGPIPPDPSELLNSKRMGELIHALREQADMVIFDTPPALVVTDAPVLATRTDGVLIVVRSGHTRRALARQTKEALGAVGAKMVGVVLNRLTGRSHYYYRYYRESEEERLAARNPLARLVRRVRLLFVKRSSSGSASLAKGIGKSQAQPKPGIRTDS